MPRIRKSRRYKRSRRKGQIATRDSRHGYMYNNILVYKAGLDKMPFPEKLRTTFTINMAGFNSTNTAAQTYNIYANYPVSPFNTAAAFTTGFTQITGGIATDNPKGLANLLGSMLYRAGRVLSSSIKIKAASGGFAQDFYLSVYPTVNTTVAGSPQAALGEPFGRHTLVSSQGGTSTISNYIKMHTLLGETAQQYQYDEDVDFQYATPPSTSCYWIIDINNHTNTNFTSSNITLDIEVKYNVELFDFQAVALAETVPA